VQVEQRNELRLHGFHRFFGEEIRVNLQYNPVVPFQHSFQNSVSKALPPSAQRVRNGREESACKSLRELRGLSVLLLLWLRLGRAVKSVVVFSFWFRLAYVTSVN